MKNVKTKERRKIKIIKSPNNALFFLYFSLDWQEAIFYFLKFVFEFFQSQVDEWIKATDYDSDGKITLEEFKLGVAGTALIEDI